MYSCDTCCKTFTSLRSFNRHNDSILHHNRQDKKQSLFMCHCGKMFKQCAGLSRHKRECKEVQKENKEDKNTIKSDIENLKNQVARLVDRQPEFGSK